MKKCIFFVFATVFALFISGCSNEISYGYSFSDELLLSRGYPQSVLDSLSVSVKRSLQSEDSLTFSCALVTVYDSENEKYSEYYITTDETVFIRDSEAPVLLNWVISETTDEKIIDVKFSYEWQELPLLRGQDKISVSWDGEFYEFVSNSFFKADMYGDHENYFVNSSDSGYAKGDWNGVTWYADLDGSGSVLFGYGEFQLRKKTSDVLDTVFYGLYVHENSLSKEYTSQIEY